MVPASRSGYKAGRAVELPVSWTCTHAHKSIYSGDLGRREKKKKEELNFVAFINFLVFRLAKQSAGGEGRESSPHSCYLTRGIKKRESIYYLNLWSTGL